MQVPDFVAERVRRPVPPSHFVTPASTPVVSFGDPSRAVVATLSLNPSEAEFYDRGELLVGDRKRLESLVSLGVTTLENADDMTVERVVRACYDYFRGPNSLWAYFGHLEPLLSAAGQSYRDGSACHLDLVQWATSPVWGKISDAAVREALLVADARFLHRQLADSRLHLVLLNGATVIKQVRHVGGRLSKVSELPAGRRPAHVVRGEMEGIPLLGWTPYIPTGFVNADRRSAILETVAAVASELGLLAGHSPSASKAPTSPAAIRGAQHADRVSGRSRGPAWVSLLLGPDGLAGMFVLTHNAFVVVTDEADVHMHAEQRMRHAWPPDGHPGGEPRAAMLRRALAIMPGGTVRLPGDSPTLELAVERAIQLLGQLSNDRSWYLYRWPENDVVRRRTRSDGRDELLDVLRHSDDLLLWELAVNASPRGTWLKPVPADRWPSDVLQVACEHEAGSVRDLALQATGTMSASALRRGTAELGVAERLYLAAQPSTSVSRLEELVQQGPSGVALAILSRQDITPALVERLATHPDPNVVLAAVTHPRLPPGELRRLARHSDPAVAQAAADNPRVTPAVLVELLFDEWGAGAGILAGHNRLPLNDARLSDPSLPDEVRRALSKRQDLPPDLIDGYARCDDVEVRRVLADRCSAAVARSLLSDSDVVVRRRAFSNQRLPVDEAFDAVRSHDITAALAVVSRPDLSSRQATVLVRAVLDSDRASPFDREAALAEHTVEPALLAALVSDPDEPAGTVAAALGNPGCPPLSVMGMLTDPDPLIRCAALTAVRDRKLPITAGQLDASEAASMRLRPDPPGVVTLEAPFHCVASLVQELRHQRGL